MRLRLGERAYGALQVGISKIALGVTVRAKNEGWISHRIFQRFDQDTQEATETLATIDRAIDAIIHPIEGHSSNRCRLACIVTFAIGCKLR